MRKRNLIFLSLIISIIFFCIILVSNNITLFVFPLAEKDDIGGRVLGISEKIFNNNQLENILPDIIDEVKNIPLLQKSQLNYLVKELPENSEKTELYKISAGEYDLLAKNGAVFDCDGGNLIYEKNADQVWPVASITKLATALIFIENNPGWDKTYVIKPEDRRDGGKIYLFSGEKIKIRDLFYFSLVGSDNTATQALVNSTGLTEKEFIDKMNEKMAQLSLKNTNFKDPIGLNNLNISTAREIAILANIALSNSDISKASLTKKYEFITEQGRKKQINNTDELLNIFPEEEITILGGKTGYINASGYCFAGKFKDNHNHEIIIVILGADDNKNRFKQTEELAKLVFENYK